MAAKDWRTETISKIRRLIEQADPAVEEEAKWIKPSNPAGVPAWSHDGLICTGETYKDKVKITFFSGAALDDPTKLFNASLDAGTRRVIDITEADTLDESAFKDLIRNAVELNVGRAAAKRRK